MIQDILREVCSPSNKTQRKSIRMQSRLFLYWSSMLLIVLSIFLVILSLTGAFSSLGKEMRQILAARQRNVVAELSEQFDRITAQGIAVSEQSSSFISNYLYTDPIDSLNDDPERIEELESHLYGYLNTALQSAPCSGGYLVLDATTNSQAPGKQFSRAGLYIRLINLSSKGTADQDKAFYRGVPNVAREHRLELHNRWKLEFDTSMLPGYDEMIGSPVERIAESAVWTERVRLTDTWENVILLMVPIRGNDGSALGVCGLEMSELYFMLSYPSEDSSFGNMVTLLAPMDGDSFLLTRAMTGELKETYLNIEDVLEVKEGKYFNQYIGDYQTYLGMHSKVDLHTADGSQLYAVTLIPQDAYLHACALKRDIWLIGFIVILAMLTVLSVHLSRSSAQPISQGLELIRSEGPIHKGSTGVSEIDELFEFLQTKMQSANGSQLPSNIEDLFTSFAHRADTLTPTEHNILKYYADGKSINEVAEQACISINTVRRHNANIYQKLGVGSRGELLLYIELFRRCDRLDELI